MSEKAMSFQEYKDRIYRETFESLRAHRKEDVKNGWRKKNLLLIN